MKQWEIRGVTAQPAMRTKRTPEPGVDGLEPLRVLVNQLPALFWTTDDDLVLTSSLGAELESLGLGANQLVGTAIEALFEADDEEPLVAAHRRALKGGSVRFEVRWGGRNFHARVRPLHDSEGQVIGTICVALDQSEAPRRERAGRSFQLISSA